MPADPFRPEERAERTRQHLGGEEAAPAPAALPELRPRGVGELLDASLDVFVARFAPLVLFSIVLWIPFHALDRAAAGLDPGSELVYDLGAGAAASWVLQSLGLGVIALLVRDHLEGRARTVASAVGEVARRALPLLAATAITTVGVLLGTLACILPGFLANWIFAVVVAVVVLERRGPLDSIRRGVRLMTNDSAASFLRWLGLFSVGTLLLLPLVSVPGVFDHPPAREAIAAALGLEGLAFELLDVALSSLFGAVGTAFGAVWVTLLYLDACVRNEGADLRARLRRLGPTPAGEGGP